jgi:hypothetical protein
MITFSNENEFKEAIHQMMAKRNGYRRYAQRKYYIKTAETEDMIIVRGYNRFMIKTQQSRTEIWTNTICLNKQTQTITLHDTRDQFKNFEKTDFNNMEEAAIDSDGNPAATAYDLKEIKKIHIISF